MTKLKKTDLRRDTVNSKHFHVGIELETYIPCKNGAASHDHDACTQNQIDYLNDEGKIGILLNYFSLDRNSAKQLEDYFDLDQWISDYMDGWTCEDSDCPYNGNGDSAREGLKDDLRSLIKNNSIKIDTDSSISFDEDSFTDAEVCWNYFASKETLKDNGLILNHLEDLGAKFNDSCGLHINLNNYLNLKTDIAIPTHELDFLFNFVDDSRKNSTFCKHWAISNSEKYSMIYNQNDRLEFRFFSPTLDADLLNHFVSLSNVIYRRLAGQNAKMSKKSKDYLVKHMVDKNGLTLESALATIELTNNLQPYHVLAAKQASTAMVEAA